MYRSSPVCSTLNTGCITGVDTQPTPINEAQVREQPRRKWYMRGTSESEAQVRKNARRKWEPCHINICANIYTWLLVCMYNHNCSCTAHTLHAVGHAYQNSKLTCIQSIARYSTNSLCVSVRYPKGRHPAVKHPYLHSGILHIGSKLLTKPFVSSRTVRMPCHWQSLFVESALEIYRGLISFHLCLGAPSVRQRKIERMDVDASRWIGIHPPEVGCFVFSPLHRVKFGWVVGCILTICLLILHLWFVLLTSFFALFPWDGR